MLLPLSTGKYRIRYVFMTAENKPKSWEDRARLFLKAEIKRADAGRGQQARQPR